MPLLVKTLFSPWRRISSYGGRSFDAKVRASVDNFVSRLVGFVSRLLVLIAATLLLALTVIAGVIATIAWPLLPIGIVYCVYRGLVG